MVSVYHYKGLVSGHPPGGVAIFGAYQCLSALSAEPVRSTLNVLNYKYKYFPSRKYLSTSTLLFGEMYLSTFRVLSKCT